MSAIQILKFINTICSNYITYMIARNKNFQLHVLISQRILESIWKVEIEWKNWLCHIQRIDLEILVRTKHFNGNSSIDLHRSEWTSIGLMQKYPPIFFLFYVSSFYWNKIRLINNVYTIVIYDILPSIRQIQNTIFKEFPR